jgi:CheY-like chemotaxis protein
MLDEEDLDADALADVLVVDDDPDSRRAVCRMVRGLGYRVAARDGGRQALDYLVSHPRVVRLMLADLAMPRMDGAELLERARDLDPGLQGTLMVGRGEPEASELLPGYRDVPLLPKPVSFADLYARLREVLGPPGTRPASPGPSIRSRPGRRTSGRHEI